MDSRRIERTAADWLARRASEDWCEADEARLEAWLAESAAHRVAWLRLKAAWLKSDRLKALGAGIPQGQIPERGRWTSSTVASAPTAGDSAASGDEAAWRSNRHGKRQPWVRIAGMAAGLLLTISAVWVLWQVRAVESSRHYTELGTVRDISLTDGSQATLGSASGIEVSFSRHQRRIDLEQGEAYFDVVHDPDRVFEVRAGTRRIVAVGTRFSVRRNGGDLRVVVTEGSVRLESVSGTGSARLLTAGTVARVDGGHMRVQEYPVEQAEELLNWRDGFLVFRNTPLSEAVAEFNRYSSRKLVIIDPAIADIPIGGNFRWNNADAFVRLLEQGFDVRARHHGHEVLLTSRVTRP